MSVHVRLKHAVHRKLTQHCILNKKYEVRSKIFDIEHQLHLDQTHVPKYLLSVEYVLDIVAGILDAETHRTLPAPLYIQGWWLLITEFQRAR